MFHGWSVVWLACLVRWLVRWLVGWMFGWLFGWWFELSVRLVGSFACLFVWLVRLIVLFAWVVGRLHACLVSRLVGLFICCLAGWMYDVVGWLVDWLG